MHRLPRRDAPVRTLAACLLLAFWVGSFPPSSAAAPTQAEIDAAEARLYELERDFQLVSERYNLVAERMARIQVEIGVAETAVKRIERRMTTRTDVAVGLARELYMGGSTVALEAILGADSLADVDAHLKYLRSSEQAQIKVFERLAVDRKEHRGRIADLEAARARAARPRAELLELKAEIEQRVLEQSEEIDRLNEALRLALERRERRRLAEEQRLLEAGAGLTVEQAGAARASNPRAGQAVEAALSQVGKPYVWGAAGPDSYDCSGLTMWAWARAGVSLPHNSGMQYAATKRVSQSDWEPGDLLFFGSPIHHVGMYIGNGKMVEAPYSGQSVRVNSAYRSDYVGAGRPGV